MDQSSWITKIVRNFVGQSPLNDMGFAQRENFFDSPLVGFSSGADPLYHEYKSHIGSFYCTPLELFTQSFPDKDVAAADITVISCDKPKNGS